MKAKTLVAVAAAGVLLVTCADDELDPEVSSRIDAVDADVADLGAELARHTATAVLAVDTLLDLAVEEIAYSDHGRQALAVLGYDLAALRACAPEGRDLALSALSVQSAVLLEEMQRHRVVMESVEDLSDRVAEERMHQERAQPVVREMLELADLVRRDALDYRCPD